jgi:hypothetical protein
LKGESVSATGVRELIVRDDQPAAAISLIGTLKPRETPDRNDDQWMIGYRRDPMCYVIALK